MNKIKEVREEKGLKQKELTEKIDIPLRTYQRYERNERLPDVRSAIRIADTLGVKDLRELFPVEN